MKAINTLLLILISSNLFPQEFTEKDVTSEVNKVTVFLDGAQIIRNKTVDLTKGKTIIKFVNLSPFIDAKSIQVKAEGELTVLSVNHQQNYLDKLEQPKELTDLEEQLEIIKDKMKVENTYLAIIKEELAFLQDNRNIGGKNEQVSINNLQQTSEFYSNKLTSLKMKEIERNKTLENLNKLKNDLHKQIATITSKKEYPAGEILVKVDAKQASKYSFELSYIVANAGWFPSYDIRAKNINEPVQLIYKANVKQDTKEDWTNVKLKFSSADPNVSGVAPKLLTYFLNYNTVPPNYKFTINSVRGRVLDSDGEPIAGVNVSVDGTTIGTVTDLNGNYSITIPNAAGFITYSSVGFSPQSLPITSGLMNVTLIESMLALEEVVVSASLGFAKSESIDDDLELNVEELNKSNVKKRVTAYTIATSQVENQTTVDFEINTPYTIRSDNKNYTVDMESYDLSALYQYYCVPKIDKDAFLIANIIDWEKYNFLEGEANVFFEDTYVGKTLMEMRYASDTLEISLGRDKKVSVDREKVKDFTDKQLIGGKKEETRVWKTTVKNNKNQAINMIILDQVPVSTLEEIEVNVQNVSGAKHNFETGEIKWEFELKPNGKKECELKYSVKYPKSRNLIVE